MNALEKFGPIDQLGPWEDCANIGERTNDLMRQNWLLMDEVVRLYNAGDHSEEVMEEIRDLLAASLDIEKKYAEAREAETVQAIHSWYVRRFGPDYQKELGWA